MIRISNGAYCETYSRASRLLAKQTAKYLHSKYGEGKSIKYTEGLGYSFVISYNTAKELIQEYNMDVYIDDEEYGYIEASTELEMPEDTVSSRNVRDSHVTVGVANQNAEVFRDPKIECYVWFGEL